MKQKLLTRILGFGLIASAAWIPSQSVRAVSFSSPPDSASPSRAAGGASRGGLFKPKPGESTPKNAPGGASRGLFTPRDGESAPQRGAISSGASRGLFTPRDGESAPQRGAIYGGASRGLFAPRDGESAPQTTAGGGARGGELFAPESSQPAPKNADGGAGRDGRRYLNYPYTNVQQPAAILALLPQTYFGTTVSQYAEILVYVPQSPARQSVFSLKDVEGNTIYEMNVPISGKAEVISIKVPTELKLEKDYQWFLALKIDRELTTRTPYVDGWIKRIRANPEIAASMQQKDLLKQATAFGKHGVWYDCVATLAKLRASQPNNSNLDKEWSELLESVGLQKIEKAPVVAFNQF